MQLEFSTFVNAVIADPILGLIVILRLGGTIVNGATDAPNTTAVMGVGAEKSLKNVKWNLAGTMVLTWILTFPGCGILAFIFTHLFLLIM